MARASVVAGAVAAGLAGVALLRRRRARPARVDVYREDGSLLSLEPGDPRAERMLALAGEAIRAARGGA